MSNLFRAEELLRAAVKRKLIEAAVDVLYARRGGDVLDARVAMYDTAVSMALFCRTSDLERCKKGEFVRAKGERPMISVTEGRLACDRASKLSRQREEIKASLREQIASFIEASQAKSEEEIRAAIAQVVGDLASRTPATPAEAAAASIQKEEAVKTEKEVGPRIALVSQVEYIEDRKALAKALAEGDAAGIARIVKMQPAKWQRKWAECDIRPAA